MEASPLEEIESRVQQRAKDVSLDMAGAGGRTELRALIDDEVSTWSDDYKRGLRAFDLAEPDVVAERAFRNVAGYGPLEPLLADDDVWEIMVATSPTCGFGQRCRSGAMCSYAWLRAVEPISAPLVVQMWCRADSPSTQPAECASAGSAPPTKARLSPGTCLASQTRGAPSC